MHLSSAEWLPLPALQLVLIAAPESVRQGQQMVALLLELRLLVLRLVLIVALEIVQQGQRMRQMLELLRLTLEEKHFLLLGLLLPAQAARLLSSQMRIDQLHQDRSTSPH